MHTKTELLAALAAGRRLTVTLNQPASAPYAGQEVEYLPRVDEANGHPDAYAWHVVGLPDWDRVRATQVIIT